VYFFHKAIECVDDSGEKRNLPGKKKPTTVRMVTAMQAKRTFKNGYVMFPVHILNEKGKYVEDAEIFKMYPILQKFQDVFLAEIQELFPHREVYFSIALVSGETPTSKELYRMSTPKILELKL